MHLRRALLLFAIVLGLAALAASLTRPARQPTETAPAPSHSLPRLEPAPAPRGPVQVRFSQGHRRRTLSLRSGQSAVVTVAVEHAGQVELEGLGLTAAAEPLTPARFDLLAEQPGHHDVVFRPASGRSSVVGVLKVTGGQAR